MRLALDFQRLLALRIAVAVVAAESGDQLDSAAGARQRLHEEPGDAAVAGGLGMVRRLKRSVERDAHGRELRLAGRTSAPVARRWPRSRNARRPAPGPQPRARAGARDRRS